jgi:hypothetical protein
MWSGNTTNASMWNGYRSRARPRGLTQGFDLVGQKTAATIEEICREEPTSSGDECAMVIWHAAG